MAWGGRGMHEHFRHQRGNPLGDASWLCHQKWDPPESTWFGQAIGQAIGQAQIPPNLFKMHRIGAQMSDFGAKMPARLPARTELHGDMGPTFGGRASWRHPEGPSFGGENGLRVGLQSLHDNKQ